MATETHGPRSPEELKSAIEEIRSGLSWARDYLDPPAQEARLADLDRQMEAPGFWDDQQKAAKISSERARVQRKLETMSSLESEVAELDSMLELADEEPEWRDELERSVDRLSGDVGRLQEDALGLGPRPAAHRGVPRARRDSGPRRSGPRCMGAAARPTEAASVRSRP